MVIQLFYTLYYYVRHKGSYHPSPYNADPIPLALFPVLCLSSLWSIRSVPGSLDPPFTHLPLPSDNHQFVLCIYGSISAFCLLPCLFLGFHIWAHEWNHMVFVIALKLYLFIWQIEREREWAKAEGVGEAGSPLNREPDVGLDPKTLRPWPEPKADA